MRRQNNRLEHRRPILPTPRVRRKNLRTDKTKSKRTRKFSTKIVLSARSRLLLLGFSEFLKLLLQPPHLLLLLFPLPLLQPYPIVCVTRSLILRQTQFISISANAHSFITADKSSLRTLRKTNDYHSRQPYSCLNISQLLTG